MVQLAGHAIVEVPGGVGDPRALDYDGKNDDYNGNGHIDFADVVWLFNHL